MRVRCEGRQISVVNNKVLVHPLSASKMLKICAYAARNLFLAHKAEIFRMLWYAMCTSIHQYL